ncbi:MAG: M20/M25/M40 family metallo-hydrolase [Myxococcales bacterium]|nr:M20/M25/M40 family metallo-hydrolase [Myxococcales bacterium]
MNRIEMYASSAHLKQGLHRVLAVAHSLASPVTPAVDACWWHLVDPAEQADARAHRLSLETLASVFSRPAVQRICDEARRCLGLLALDHEAVAAAFRAAIISGRAHRAHFGRDVYGTRNKVLWDHLCADFGAAVASRYGETLGDGAVDRDASRPSADALATLATLTAFDTSPDGPDHQHCVDWLVDQLEALGFEVETMGHDLGRPLVVARRPARGLAGHVALYGHYDVTPFGREQKWRHPPRTLTDTDGRLFARGVADNKGPLACRLAALRHLDRTPALTWFVQGEEETGSAVARTLLPSLMASLRPTLWLDETGYHDHEDGTLRLIARTIGPSDRDAPVDAALGELLRGLRGLASRWGVAARHEQRGLNKSAVAGGCPFDRNLPQGARYAALGVNDSGARIHGLNESVPAWPFPLHAAQLDVVFRWAHHTAEEEAR